MQRVIGMDIHRTFGEVVFWEDGKLRHGGRVDMTTNGAGRPRQKPFGDGRGGDRGDRQLHGGGPGAVALR